MDAACTIGDVVVVDLDGTLCDATHRQEFAQRGEWCWPHSGLPGWRVEYSG